MLGAGCRDRSSVTGHPSSDTGHRASVTRHPTSNLIKYSFSTKSLEESAIMKISLKSIFLLTALFTLSVGAQNNYPKTDFIPPVDFNMALSGTFGELRDNHFHSGMDIKTWGAQGKPLYAVADGFVSRIKVSPGGFGKAIYIEHPNGYTSVYAHCLNFIDTINIYVKDEQYKQESFEVNLFPDKEMFPVRQGEVIAHSGNTGSSMGPHLHFEIRETKGQIPVNPLLFGLPVDDFIRPKIKRLIVYPYGNFSLIEGENQPIELALAGWGPDYRLKNSDTLMVSGKVYFGIETYDQLNDAKNKNGVYSIQVFIDSALVYSHQMEKFPFSESKYVNSLIDYSYYSQHKKRIQKTYIEPGNNLSVYANTTNNGIFELIDDKTHTITYIVKDASGNGSTLKFQLKSSPPTFQEVFANGNHKNHDIIFGHDRENIFETDSLKFTVPKGALYDTLQFQFSEQGSDEFEYSKIYSIHNNSKPLHKPCKLMIVPKNIEEKYQDKYLIARLAGKNNKLLAAGGKWEDGFLTAWISSFGSYVIAIDTIPPQIEPVNIFPGKNLEGQNNIRFKIEDGLAGIKDYRATMNGKWILMEWDPKNYLLTYRIDERTKKGDNQFKLIVTDGRGNESVYGAKLTSP